MFSRKHVLFLVIVGSFMFSSCICVSQEDYSAIISENEALKEQLKNSVSSANESYSKLQAEYDAYKEKMKSYENLAEEEAKAREIEAEKVLQKQREEAEAKRLEDERAREAEEARGYDTGITYNGIARNPEIYIGKKVKFKGKVLQVIESPNYIDIRLAVDGDYDHVIHGQYSKGIVESRVLENDMITIYGVSMGTVTYESILGGPITIPSVGINKIDFGARELFN